MSLPVPFNDLSRIHQPLIQSLKEAISGVIESNAYIQGPEVSAFEGEFAAYCQTAHAIGVSSGTDALLAALMALDIGKGDEVITTPFTFFATAGVIHRLGATPVFADIEEESFNIDPEAVGKCITANTKAIIAVHLFGRMADMRRLNEIASEYSIPLIEDAAQSVGAEYEDGRRAGSIGRIGCFSFFPAKNLGGFGDGGCITTQDDVLAKRMRALRVHGAEKKYHHDMVGGNFRLDALQAAILRVKLKALEEWTEDRISLAQNMRNALAKYDETPALRLPKSPVGRHVYNQFVIRSCFRDDILADLKNERIGTAIYYPKSLHQQPCFAHLGYQPGDFPISEKACTEVLALPNFPGMKDMESQRVAEVLSQSLKRLLNQ